MAHMKSTWIFKIVQVSTRAGSNVRRPWGPGRAQVCRGGPARWAGAVVNGTVHLRACSTQLQLQLRGGCGTHNSDSVGTGSTDILKKIP